MKIKHLLITLLILLCISFSKSTNISGQVEYFYMTRLDNSQLVNIPFRLLDFNVQHQVTDNFNLMGNFGIEYRNRKDTDFLTDSNIEDFLLDIRELYMSYYFKNSEVRIGKQIHAWGSVDENSPIDNLNAYDYYYLLLGGAEKKLGAYSLAFDTEIDMFGPCQLSFVYSPMHNTSRLPIDDPDYPIGFSLPEGETKEDYFLTHLIFNDDTPGEYGMNLKWSFGLGQFSFSHLNLYDRLLSISGANVYSNISQLVTDVELFYSYRLTRVNNIGAVFLFDDFTLSFDYANFNAHDQNDKTDYNILHPTRPNIEGQADYFEGEIDEPNFFIFQETGEDGRLPFQERAHYTQLAIQFEMPLENDYTLNMQYFKHDLYRHTFNPIPIEGEVSIPNASIDPEDFNLANFFIPGVGTPYAMITPEALLINVEKVLSDYDLTLDFSAFLDATSGNGRLLSFEGIYDLGESFEFGFGMTKIFGHKNRENYNFNNMKSFSSFRSRITYYF